MLLLHLHWCLVFLSGFIDLSIQQNDPGKVTCYGWTGREFNNNTICPGSNVCCNTEDLCTPNRFCYANNQTIVPACAVFPWNDCANICQYDPGTGFLPRAVQCADGSYCCDNDPQCCANNEGIVLNGLGAVVSTDGGLAALSTSTLTFSTTSSDTSTTSTLTIPPNTGLPNAGRTGAAGTSAASATESASPVSSTGSGLSSGAIAGIAICGVAVLAAIITFAFWVGRRRGRARQGDDGPNSLQPSGFIEHEPPRVSHVSRQFLHGTPVYDHRSRQEMATYLDSKRVPRTPQEMYAGTPDLKR